MQQVTQQLKSGKMKILEVPFPAISENQIMVRNFYSVISAGTEGKTVTDARKGYIAKAKSRQKEVKQVINLIKTNGFKETYKVVMNKLEAPSPLGYSCAGEVIAIGNKIRNFKVGDYVACGGQGAYHSEVISVYENLCVKIPESVDLKQAAFATIASIAIQGIRQADLHLGENCAIIGLGLIGQITYKILEASGIRAIGIDISEEQIEVCRKNGLEHTFNRNQSGLEEEINRLTDGSGADGVIITAGTSSLDPVEFAGVIARKKGKVVIVGAVPTGFSRNNYYKKELDLKMSSSYGPGRYDLNYEEKGVDYPIGYVRWTENRNMKSFIRLISGNKLNIKDLITHTFSLIDAPKAYDLILEKSEPFTGISIKYNTESELSHNVISEEAVFSPNKPNVGFIGAGSFAQGTILPNLKDKCNLISIATAQGNETVYVSNKYRFGKSFENGDDVIKDKDVNTVFIVTRHNLHTEFILKALKEGKNIFVEKPLAMNLDELSKIAKLYKSLEKKPRLMVGFNRRFSPYIKKVKEILLDDQLKAINIRINAGQLPSDHWVNDPDIGGGRIIGEACHFIDLAIFLAGNKIVSVSAETLIDPDNLNNTVVINLKFSNGSIANISYFSNGSKQLPKEYIEIFSGGSVIVIEDFNEMRIYSEKIKKIKFKKQDKGHKEEINNFINSIKDGKPAPISFEDCYHSTYATFKVIESINTKRRINI